MREIIPSLLAQDVQQYTPLLQEFESLHTGCHVNIEQITWEEAWSKLFNYTIHGEGRMFQRLDRTGAVYW
jgi:pyruvate dehydrogenase complex dehydrogenase (E1) component